MTEKNDFPVNFRSDVDLSETEEFNLYTFAENSLRDLAAGHQDIISASLHLKEPVAGRATSYLYEVTITLNFRPHNLAATEKSDNLGGALKGALRAIERQVRAERDKLRQVREPQDPQWMIEEPFFEESPLEETQ